MATSSNGQRRPFETPRTYCVEIFAQLQGGGVGVNLVNLDASVNGGGEIVSAVWQSTGTYAITFAKEWPQLLFAPLFTFIDSNGVLGFDAQATAMNVVGKTATFAFSTGAALGDVATTTTVYVRWTVRAVNKN